MTWKRRVALAAAAVVAWVAAGGTAAAECLPAGGQVQIDVDIVNDYSARYTPNGWDASVRTVVSAYEGLAGLVQEYRIPDRTSHRFVIWAAPILRMGFYLEDAGTPDTEPFPMQVSLSDVMAPLLAKAPACAKGPVTLPMAFHVLGPGAGFVEFILDGVTLNPHPAIIVPACPGGAARC